MVHQRRHGEVTVHKVDEIIRKINGAVAVVLETDAVEERGDSGCTNPRLEGAQTEIERQLGSRPGPMFHLESVAVGVDDSRDTERATPVKSFVGRTVADAEIDDDSVFDHDACVVDDPVMQYGRDVGDDESLHGCTSDG